MNKTLKNKLDRVFSEFIRLRDATQSGYIRCFCCGKVLPWRDSENMHFIPRQHMSLRYNEINCNSGCTHCNHFMNGNIEAYTLNLKRVYGNDILERLMLIKNTPSKMGDFEANVLIDHYKTEVKRIRKEKGL